MSKTKKISLTQGKFATVDAEDFEYLSQWKWHFSNGYALRKQHLGRRDGKDISETIHMHRVVNKTPADKITDHRNHNKLDNRGGNLRSCVQSQNQHNQKIRNCNKSSRFKGVHFHKPRNKWQVRIAKDGKRTHIGLYPTQEEAALAYNKAAIELHGEFASLNNVGT